MYTEHTYGMKPSLVTRLGATTVGTGSARIVVAWLV
jgi:hypothetical protein